MLILNIETELWLGKEMTKAKPGIADRKNGLKVVFSIYIYLKTVRVHNAQWTQGG